MKTDNKKGSCVETLFTFLKGIFSTIACWSLSGKFMRELRRMRRMRGRMEGTKNRENNKLDGEIIQCIFQERCCFHL